MHTLRESSAVAAAVDPLDLEYLHLTAEIAHDPRRYPIVQDDRRLAYTRTCWLVFRVIDDNLIELISVSMASIPEVA